MCGQDTFLGAWRPGWLRDGERSQQMQPPEESEPLNTARRGKAAVQTRGSCDLISLRLLQTTWPS